MYPFFPFRTKQGEANMQPALHLLQRRICTFFSVDLFGALAFLNRVKSPPFVSLTDESRTFVQSFFFSCSFVTS